MKRAALIAGLLLLPGLAVAREKYDAKTMSEAATAALEGKRLAIAIHELPKLQVSPGASGESGAFVIRKVTSDPAETVARQLAPAIAKEFGMQLRADVAYINKSRKPAEAIAAVLPDADYVLDVATDDRRVFFVPSSAILTMQDWKYWVGYGVRVQLLYRETGRPVFSAHCFADTQEHTAAPGMEALAADDARLFREVSDSLAWKCLRRIAHYVPLPDEAVPEAPADLADPMSARE